MRERVLSRIAARGCATLGTQTLNEGRIDMSGRLANSLVVLTLLVPTGSRGEAADQAEVRTWADSTGNYRVEAALIDFRDGHVQLKKKDGQTITLPLAKLGKADQKFVQELVAKGGDAGTAAGTSQQYTYTNRSTGEVFHGRTVKVEKADNRRALLVESDDGKQLRIWADEWDITSGAPQHGAVPDTLQINGERNTASTPGSAPGASDSRLLTVVCTGIGLSPDEARQNAFASAIEQTMGVLVDAETLVENDEIIRDNVLTFTRGTVKHFQVLSNWQQGDLHYVRIRAEVAVDELTARLKDKRITVSKFPGEQIDRQFRLEVEQGDHAVAMVRKALEFYSLDRLLKVEVTGEPELVKRDQINATVRVPIRAVSDMHNWKKLHTELTQILRNGKVSSASFRTTADKNGKWWDSDFYQLRFDIQRVDWVIRDKYEPAAKEPGIWLFLSRAFAPDGHKTLQSQWDAYRIPATAAPVLVEILEPQWQLRVDLLDANDARLGGIEVKSWSTASGIGGNVHSLQHRSVSGGVDTYNLAPFAWVGDYCFSPAVQFPEILIEIAADDLPKIGRVAAYIEKVEP